MSVTSRNNTARMLGIVLLAMGVCMIPSFAVGILFDERRAAISFFITMCLCIMIGGTLLKIYPSQQVKQKRREAYLLISLCWIISSLVGAIPLFASGSIPTFLDAFFEACSGFTTTGATIIKNVESTSRAVLLWRSTTVWLGGCGIILFTPFLHPFSNIAGQKISRQETPLITYGRIDIKNRRPTLYLFGVYIGITILMLVLFKARGMRNFDALVHALSIAGTGGFSSYNNGIAHFHDPWIYWIVIGAMTTMGCNLNTLSTMMRHGVRNAFRNSELKFYFRTIGLVTVLITANLLVQGNYTNFFTTLTAAAFQTVSALSTTGQHVVNYNLWPTFSKMLLLTLMLIGACSASMGGGPKIMRIIISLKLIRRGIALKLHPNRVFALTLNKTALTQETATNIANHMFLYFFLIFSGSLLLSINGMDLVTTFTATISCLNNNGIAFGLAGNSMHFDTFSPFSKTVMCVLMTAGRLELFSFFMLFSSHYWNPDKA